MKSWTKTILGIGVSCSLLGAALAGYGFATGGLSDLENSTDIVRNVDYQKATLNSFSKIDIDSTTSDVIISKANIDKPFISYSANKKTPHQCAAVISAFLRASAHLPPFYRHRIILCVVEADEFVPEAIVAVRFKI